eukprot:scaffold41066_cov31-Tisochrysis_lutea.AAC.2
MTTARSTRGPLVWPTLREGENESAYSPAEPGAMLVLERRSEGEGFEPTSGATSGPSAHNSGTPPMEFRWAVDRLRPSEEWLAVRQGERSDIFAQTRLLRRNWLCGRGR